MNNGSNTSSGSSSSIGFVGLLQIVFITLKLCGVIHWSWFWVLSPIWISAIILVVFLVVIFMIFVFDGKGKKK